MNGNISREGKQQFIRRHTWSDSGPLALVRMAQGLPAFLHNQGQACFLKCGQEGTWDVSGTLDEKGSNQLYNNSTPMEASVFGQIRT